MIVTFVLMLQAPMAPSPWCGTPVAIQFANSPVGEDLLVMYCPILVIFAASTAFFVIQIVLVARSLTLGSRSVSLAC